MHWAPESTQGLAAAALLALGALASPATVAQTVACGERDRLVQRLKVAFGEAQKGAGLVNRAQLLEVWSSDETGTWTVPITAPNGTSCIVAAGKAWRNIEADLAQGDPA